MQQPRRWFITGASTGFGRVLARRAVAQGDKVVGTVRSAALVDELAVEGIIGVLLDVTDRARIQPAIDEAIAAMGGIDVLVNNAGYGLMGAIEAFDETAIRDQMEANFFGTLNVTRAALPDMRGHGGTIVFILSMAGVVGMAGAGAYCASKFAMEGLAEALSAELAVFGIKVMIVEPSSFRTDFHGRSMHTTPVVLDEYRGTQAGDVNDLLVNYRNNEAGDPEKGISVIMDALNADEMPLRLPLGADAVHAIEAKHRKLLAELETWKAAAIATAVDR